MTVSSPNVPNVMFGTCGRSDVNSRHSMCPRTLPFYTVAERNGSVQLLTVPQRQTRDAANPGATQPDSLSKHALRFVVFFVQFTDIMNGKSANTKT